MITKLKHRQSSLLQNLFNYYLSSLKFIEPQLNIQHKPKRGFRHPLFILTFRDAPPTLLLQHSLHVGLGGAHRLCLLVSEIAS